MKGSFKYVVFLFVLCVFAAFFVSSSFFQIKHIDVNGIKSVSKEEIVKLSTIYYGENIFRINKKNSMKSIFQSPYVKMIKIKRVLPNKVIIDIIEREAIAYVPYVGSYLNIDEEGMIIEVNPAIKKSAMPVIKGMKFDTFKIGDMLEIENKQQLETAKQIIAELKRAELVSRITEIDVSSLDNIKMKAGNDIKINLGDEENISYKVSFAKSILEDVSKNNLKGTVEMGHKGNPIFRPE